MSKITDIYRLVFLIRPSADMQYSTHVLQKPTGWIKTGKIKERFQSESVSHSCLNRKSIKVYHFEILRRENDYP